MFDLIDDYTKRPDQYRRVDGINELAVGVDLAAFALLTFLHRTAPSGSVWHNRALYLLCVAALTLLGLYSIVALRKRITFPRTGYVKYRRGGIKAFFLGLAAGAAFAALFGAVLLVHHVLPHFAPHSFEGGAPVWTSGCWALFFAFCYAQMTRMDAAWRWITLVAMIVLPPALVSAFPLSRAWADALAFGLTGSILIVSGAITLTLYLRRNPVPEQVAE